jgi:hypothetical protein
MSGYLIKGECPPNQIATQKFPNAILIINICFASLFFSCVGAGVFVGDQRKIGFWWSLALSILFTPVVGYIVSIRSKITE